MCVKPCVPLCIGFILSADNNPQRGRKEMEETTSRLVLLYGEVCNSGKAGTVAQREMNSEEYADCEGDEDRLADTFGDCWVLDRATAQVMAVSNGYGSHGAFNRKAGKNALEYFVSEGVA